ncbi:holo-ACP synthase [Candidatus Mycoplasma mahonii]|uniref:holo-ACP synthase n=1 Tax=Candidatus Mycoplasma mahonii TaxID=3004105 RepID=UPI0026F1CCA8|nr:4'-phosphopantetheinyl transferase superfamily protein [Candidatus Mycoplasma mahonii]WKX02227.1 4'-phosphopantetheinyl transferase superfamily protein [Candidatus Mycoplasma mahonii]
MLGIDLTQISRFKDVSDSFIRKILHPDEIVKYNLSEDKPKFLAKRWAVKEALYKADNSLKYFNKIKLFDDNRTMRYPGYNISTSNEGDYYVAIVQKEK